MLGWWSNKTKTTYNSTKTCFVKYLSNKTMGPYAIPGQFSLQPVSRYITGFKIPFLNYLEAQFSAQTECRGQGTIFSASLINQCYKEYRSMGIIIIWFVRHESCIIALNIWYPLNPSRTMETDFEPRFQIW